MKFKLPAILVILAVVVLQAALGDMPAIFGVKPSLVMVAVYAFSITGGEARGTVYGIAAGFALDCLSGGIMGVFLSGYALAGYLAGRIGKRVFNIGDSANFAGILGVSLAQCIYTAVLLKTFVVGYDIMRGLLAVALPSAFYTAVAGAAALKLFNKGLTRRVPWLRTFRHVRVRL